VILQTSGKRKNLIPTFAAGAWALMIVACDKPRRQLLVWYRGMTPEIFLSRAPACRSNAEHRTGANQSLGREIAASPGDIGAMSARTLPIDAAA
jgi:hypothetical protein